MDGSIVNDIPMREITTTFNVHFVIVAQGWPLTLILTLILILTLNLNLNPNLTTLTLNSNTNLEERFIREIPLPPRQTRQDGIVADVVGEVQWAHGVSRAQHHGGVDVLCVCVCVCVWACACVGLWVGRWVGRWGRGTWVVGG